MELLNQAVLLKGVNDNTDCLVELSQQLGELGVLPYYLHALDKVVGASHFEVPENEGSAIIARMRQRLPGYLVPRYVRETQGEPCKQPVAP